MVHRYDASLVMNRKYRLAFGAMLTCLMALQAAAADDLPYDFPRYASEATCNATFMAESDDDVRRTKVKKCSEEEQHASDLLKSAWKDASLKVKNKCEESTKAGSYVSLYRCVVEQKRQENLPILILPKASDAKAGTGSGTNSSHR